MNLAYPSPATASLPRSGVPGDLEGRPGLGGGHQLDRVHVDVRGQAGRPVDRLGDVVGGHRLHARVDVVRLGPVAAEPDERELRVGHAGLDAADPDPGAVQVAAQVQAELVDEGLGAAVHVPARVRVAARHRAEVDHVTAAAGDHAGQDGAGAVDQALAVGVDHLVPVVKLGLLGRLEAEREAGVIDKHVDGL